VTTETATATSGRARITEMGRAECLKHLEFGSFLGRLGYVAGGVPMIIPVNYLATDDSIVFCSASGTKLEQLATAGTIAFEVDESRPLEHSGWSVLVHGTVSEITDQDELEQLRRGQLRSWAVDPTAHWMRVSIDSISGRTVAKIRAGE
jgi:nitroimidazol reductase NimA-like FMN-containing flavoprotein (pyridoxamine 5'-phosphate oxidase superfamily)